jgi:acyl carrier protein
MRVVNSYGVTEATIDSSYFEGSLDIGSSSGQVPIGTPLPNMRLYIMDRCGRLQPPGIAGELYIGGSGVARGYLNRDDLTAERFIPDPFCPPKRVYKSGDLCRWLGDGNIEFLGRIDQQLKIRGYRIEPGEIEGRLSSHEHIQAAAVLAMDPAGEGDKYLCAYFVSPIELVPDQVRAFLAAQLPDHMIPFVIMPVERIPLTANGKVDRRALPSPQVTSVRAYAAPGNVVEETLVCVWTDVLAVPIGIDDNFFELGGHSLKATIMVSKVHQALDVRLPLSEVFRTPTIRALARYIKRAAADKLRAVEPVEDKEYYPLSSAQDRLYILQHMGDRDTAYNMQGFIPLPDEPDRERVAEIFARLMSRREILRTSFLQVGDRVVQRVSRSVTFHVDSFAADLAPSQLAERVTAFIRPFDLSRAPLLRVALFRGGAGPAVLLLDIHHLVCDGISLDILKRDFLTLYRGARLQPPKLQYRDYCLWLESKEVKEALEPQEAYWLEVFEQAAPQLALPLDFPRPPVRSLAGHVIQAKIEQAVTTALEELTLAEGVTMYMLILALYNVLLLRLCGQEDVIVGTVVSGRSHPDLEDFIGPFVNLLPIRNYPAASKSFRSFLAEVKENTLAAFENQGHQFEALVQRVGQDRDAGRHPLLDVGFTLQNVGSESVTSFYADYVPSLFETSRKVARLDMNLEAVQAEDGLVFELGYCTKLFKAETIRRFLAYFDRIIREVIADPARELGEIDLITNGQRDVIRREIHDAQEQLDAQFDF